MLVRRCRTADAAAVAALATELGYPSDADKIGERLAWLLAQDRHAVLLAEADGCVIGLLHMNEERALLSEPVAEIAGFVVAAASRGQGAGKALLAAALDWAAARGLANTRVHSNMVRTEAHAWYRAAGFTLQKTQGVLVRATRIGLAPAPASDKPAH